MTNEVRQKLQKVYELVKRGENGEKLAAEKALERLIKKYNLDQKHIDEISKQEYRFKYSTNLEMYLIQQLIEYFFQGKDIELLRDTYGTREIIATLEYSDFVMLECSYEYFRRHMKKEFNRVCLPKIKRCRSTKTRNKRRAELQKLFFGKYVMASKIYHDHQIEVKNNKDLSLKELQDRQALEGVQGGTYNKQVSTGLYLD